jgi:pimeloyl-ACP methyl ester carboxylesterase
MRNERRLVPMPDGREIDVLTAGPDDGFPLVVHEGTPVGLVLSRKLAAAAAGRGLRVVMTARPGYEGSTARPDRRVADVAADVAAVLDTLGADTFVSIGFSGGGPHSLACAALLPGRCLAAASVAGVGPYAVDDLDFLAGMGPENVTEFSLAVRGADALTPFLEQEAAALRQVTGEQIVAALGGLISGADAGVLTGEFAADLAAGLRAAVRAGIAGWRDDDLAFAAGWGFSLDDLAGRAAIWQGDQDRMVPFAHGQWLAAHIPGARVHLEPGAGHLTMTVTAIEAILGDLLDLAGAEPPRARSE